mgnify:CR=1 FL=1
MTTHTKEQIEVKEFLAVCKPCTKKKDCPFYRYAQEGTKLMSCAMKRTNSHK